MSNNHLHHLASPLPNPIYWGERFVLKPGFFQFATPATQTALVTDQTVYDLYGAQFLSRLQASGLSPRCIIIPPGEASKSRAQKAHIEDKLMAWRFGRDSAIIALGGGVVTDLAGFVASTYCRGIPVVYFPTTLLAMIDAAIGGKTGINTDFGKNMLGTFCHPQAILLDKQWLETLPFAEFASGLSEMIKHSLIDDVQRFKIFAQHLSAIMNSTYPDFWQLVCHSIQTKARIVMADEKECHQREMLNFGHTIGHAIEKASGYQCPHGQAVAHGMVAESWLSYKMGHLAEGAYHDITSVLRSLLQVMPQTLTISHEAVCEALSWDKKQRQSQHRCVLLKEIGAVVRAGGRYAHPIDQALLHKAVSIGLSGVNGELGVN